MFVCLDYNVNDLPPGRYFVLDKSGEVYDDETEAQEMCFSAWLLPNGEVEDVYETDSYTTIEIAAQEAA